jgi:alpha-tubulin suppressor-like RCC1 family protein
MGTVCPTDLAQVCMEECMQLNLGKMILAGCLMFGLVACPAPPAPTPDFGLTLGSPSLSVKQAESGTISVSLNKTNGFAGSVALTLEGAPTGVTGSFNPASTTSTSTLTLNVAANAALGNTTLTVKGVSGALTKTSTFDLTVTAAAPSVTSVTISAPATTVLPATNTTLTATVAGNGAFNNAVTWSIVSGTAGAISATTGAAIDFMVPGSGNPPQGTVVIKATSNADSSKFGTITMTVQPASITGLTLTAVKSALKTGESTLLSATVTSSGNMTQFNPLSTWKIEDDGVGTLSSGNGSLLSTGFGTTNTYFAPSTSVGRIVRITASSVQDPTQKKTIFISINPNQASISGGQFFSLGLKPDGTVLSWGRATNGELGNNSNQNRDTPGAIQDSSSNVKPIVALSAGGFHALALKNDGTMLAWGDNVYGQLGTGLSGAANSKFVAVDVVPAVATERFSAIAAGTTHSLALRTDGVVVSWGDGRKKQLGPNLTFSTVPTVVTGTSDIVAIAAGVAHSLALKSDGTVLAWGDDEFGQLGNDAASLASSTPVVVSGATNIVAIAAGGNHSLALKSDGTLLAWGANFSGEIGDGTFVDKFIPVAVAGSNSNNIVAIACGLNHSLALKKDGTVLAWGANFSGQLGNDDPNFSDKFTPVAVAGSHSNNIVAIAGGLNHSLALKKDGTVLAWGSDEKGQLGDGTPLTDKTTPTPVVGASNIVAIAAGGLHSLALKSNGTMQSWGEDEKEQLGNGATTGNQASVVDVLLGALTIRLP